MGTIDKKFYMIFYYFDTIPSDICYYIAYYKKSEAK